MAPMMGCRERGLQRTAGRYGQPRVLALLLLSLSTVALCQHDKTGEHLHSLYPLRSEVAIGFNLGQSYGTSVARFENGTILNLAKVPASPEYMTLMARLVEAPQTPYWRSLFGAAGKWLGWWRLLRRLVGFAGTDEATILAQLVTALKAESEAALEARIDVVSVTAPWVAAWENDIPVDSVINDALVSAGLKPWTWEASGPIYLSEPSGVLAANGHRLCKERWCRLDEDDTSDLWPQIVFFISLTNHSLYTTFQATRCYYHRAWESYLPTVDTKYGLDEVPENTTEHFWNALRDHLLSSVVEFSKRNTGYKYSNFIVLTAGESADRPEFVDVVRSVAESIPKVRTDHGAATLPKVELVMPDDPAFSAARGAAFWLRSRMDWSYCDGFDDIVSQYDVTNEGPDGHIEL
ncbi:uncharacterized protein B0H64DRAFT_379382 [Chaetomium fimeti]|uniref:Uncharacterized protein n=1 Tax=Chaetomium fimeti TaxID=1854472 RepID=A0AAE0HNR6_9PEZI|nr:hypothetical protein B0H64DRAFT_379382 [Chaetomium fimeti]